jgi:hypothetical protein
LSGPFYTLGLPERSFLPFKLRKFFISSQREMLSWGLCNLWTRDHFSRSLKAVTIPHRGSWR